VTAPVSLLAPMSGSALPAPTVAALDQADQALIAGLQQKMALQSVVIGVRWQYYDGLQRMQNLGISVPPALSGIRTVVDWPRICVDPLVQRCVLDGFRLAGATDVDDELQQHAQANDLAAELPLAFLDAFVAGRGYVIVGSPDVEGESPLVTVESPLNMAVVWDPRTRRITSAFQAYEVEGVYRSVLYKPDQTISMSRNDFGSWAIDNIDDHNFGEVPVVRLPNRARTTDREGRSEISAAVMNTTDSTCRSLLGMEIAREFYSVPHRYILGATESDFVGADGVAKSSLDMVMSKMLALERDDSGQTPTVGQFQAFDPSVFTKIIDEHAQLMASYTGFPPSYFGQTSTANPASADAIRVAENGLIKRSLQAQAQFSGPLKKVMQLVWRFAHNGETLPKEVQQLEADWRDPATATPAGTSDAITKQISVGAIPATSDVTLGRLGYTAIERERLAADRAVDAGAQVLAELATSLQAKEARSVLTVAHDINPTASAAAPTPAATAPTTPVNDGTTSH
jgi:hypothetical protein